MIRRHIRTRQRKRNAFTLIEMIVVVAIIVALAGMGGFYFMGQLEDSRKKTTQANCKTLKKAVEVYEMRHGAGSLTDLNVLKVGTNEDPPILEKDFSLIDPWNNPYTIIREANGMVYVQSQGPPGGQPIH